MSSNHHCAHRLPADLSSKIEDELYALNLLQLTRDYPLSPYCLRYPLDFLLESLPEEVRRRVVVLLDPGTTPVLEAKLFGEDEVAFEEAMEYLEHQDREEPPGSPQGQPKLRGGDGDDEFDDYEEDEDDQEEEERNQDRDDSESEDDESEHDSHYPAFFRPIRRHGEYVFWPVDAGGHQWLLCVLHLQRSWSRGPYETVTDFAVVDPEWSRDGSGDADSISAPSRERVRRVTQRLVRVFRAGGIEIDPYHAQRQIWVAPSTAPPPQPVHAEEEEEEEDGGGGGGGAHQPHQGPAPSPRWESGVRCFQLARELLGRVAAYACPGAPGFEDERFFGPGAGWVDADAVRHEMVGMALQRCNAALGYACRYYLAPIDTLVLVGGGDGGGDGDGHHAVDGGAVGGGGGEERRRIVPPDALRPSRAGKRMHAPDTFDLLNDAGFGDEHQGGGGGRVLGGGAGRKRSGGGMMGGVLKAISSNAGSMLGGISGRSGGGGIAPDLLRTPPPIHGGMRAMNSYALNRRPSKRTAADAALDGGADDGEDGGGAGDGGSPTRPVKRARISGASVRQ